MQFNRKSLWISSRDYFFITLGIFLYAFGFSAFIFQEKVVIGGVAGLGTIIYLLSERYIGYGIPVAISQYILNLILLAFAYRIVGKQFVLRTIFGATVISIAIGVLTPLFDGPLVDGQPFMNVIIGSLLCGVGLGLSFTHNGSTGGTDIVAAIVSKKSNVSIGRTMLYVDMGIISSSYLVLHQIDTVVYGFVVLVIVSMMADMVINTNRQAVQFIIFSPQWQEIATAINNEANRGCTVINGMGWYSKQDIKILLVMCRKIESVTIFRIIKSIDENAFITQANVNGVYGKGFDAMKLKVNPRHGEHHHDEATQSSVNQPE
ncbi:MAG: YitT family protein [Bacteroides sp.]|nr:YitT family protein [Bacteroides sp.]MCM1414110.1 YitT family protein [Bacteroides sp.]MCM1472374.1 YitT family protein [Bacteroides sp.]